MPRRLDENQSPRPLTQWSLATLVIASMIGAGVFTTSGFATADLGDPRWVMMAWTIGGVIAICGAVSYGRLAHLLTENGGEYLYLSRFVHPAAGFIAGWVSFLAGFTGAGALAALAFETYAFENSERPEWLPPGAIAIALVILCTLLHAFHTQRGAVSQNVLVAAKLLLIGLFIAWSFRQWGQWHVANVELPKLAAPSVLTLATSVMWISLSYCGFNAAIYVASEAERGAVDIAGAMLKAAIGVTILYLVLNAIFVFGPSPEQISGQKPVAAIAAREIGGARLAILVRIAICLGLASSVSSTVMAGPRVYAKMAADGVFPKWFNSRQSPPTRSVLMQGIAIAIVVSIASLQELLEYLSLTLSLCSAATVGVLLASQAGRNSTGIIGNLTAWFYVLATCLIISLAAWHRPDKAIATTLTILSGGIIYLVMRKMNRPSP